MRGVLAGLCLCLLFLSARFARADDRETGTIRVVTLSYPPFIEAEGDGARGPLVDIVIEAFSRAGLVIGLQVLPGERCLQYVEAGTVDAFFSLKKSASRERTLLFTAVPLIRQDFVFFARKERAIAYSGDSESVAGYTIGIVSGASYGSVFDQARLSGKYPNLDETTTFELNVRKLIAGRVDLIINGRDVGLTLIRRSGDEAVVEILEPPVESVESYLAFTRKRDFRETARRFDSALRSMVLDGFVAGAYAAHGISYAP